MFTIHTAYIALGSNLGDRGANLQRALVLLAPAATVVRVSPQMEFPAVDSPPGSPAFLNAAAEIKTILSPRELLDHLLEVEAKMGRQRSIKNAPRIIDLDLLLYDDLQINQEHLQVPHPRMHERRFVLEPLAAIAPDVMHPVLRKTIGQLLPPIRKR